MPRILELGLNRIFRSRWGVAVVIVGIVVAVVGIGRLLSDGNNSGASLGSVSQAPPISLDPNDDDSVIDSGPPPSPSTNPGKAKPEAVAYAFASAWANHKNTTPKAWRDRLVPNSTKNLADELSGVDPVRVPADRVVGRPNLVPVSETVVNAVVTMDSGKLNLRLVAPDGTWLVDGIDWNQG